MKKTRASNLIHGIVETGQVERTDRSAVPEARLTSFREALERSLNRGPIGGAESLDGGWSIAADASLPGGRLSVRLYAPGMFPGGACASSMSVTYHLGEPPVLWASRASIHLAPDPGNAADEAHDLEVGLAWAWIPLVEAWIHEDWVRTLAAQEEVRDDGGFEIDEEGDTDEEEYARKWYSRRQQQEEYDYNQDWESPWDWAPIDVREDWGFSELDLEEEREGHLPPEGPWD